MNQQELREQENRCIQEQAPACTATCPAHVDVRGMAAAIAKDDFSAAFNLYRKSVPFPGIVSHICNQPCQTTCLRKDLGGPIEIAALERAALEFGSQDSAAIKPLPRKSKTAVVIGAGISGLTVAYDLARKGWGVVIYEAGDRLGGGLWKTPPDLLPREVLVNDLQVIETLGVEIRLNTVVGRSGGNGHSTFLARLCEEYDAVYLGIGAYSSDVPDLKLDENGQVAVDPLTFQTSLEKVFAGGDILRFSANTLGRELPHSAILSVSEGRRAATSIDRFLQKVSLTASRNNEGPYDTKLYTNTSEILPQTALIATDLSTSYSRKVAETEAARCIQCECLECVKNCEYLRHYKGYPKKYIREVYNNLSIVMGTRYSNQFINTCALCGLCAEVCPTDVDFGEICRNAREQMVEQKRMPPSAHDFALQDMAFSNGEKFSLAKNAPDADVSEYVFFPGCQLSGSSPENAEKAYAFLREKLPRVGLMLRCCGAPADWAGRKDIFAASQSELRAEYGKLGRPKVVLACSSCYQVFQKYYPDLEIISLWELYDQLGLEPVTGRALLAKITVHDPCSTRYESGIQDSVRNILKKLGCQIEELPNSREKTECCSYGGLMWLANKAVAAQAVERRINQSPLDYVTYCAMCRDFFARRGKRTLHLLDLIYGDADENAPAVGFSERHENRARLKEKLLRDLWSEAMPEGADFEKIRLILPDEVQTMVEDRLILVEDIQKVLENAERTGKRMFNPQTGHYLAYLKPTSVTYWVEYTPQTDGAFLVHKAYSHRMEIGMRAEK
ncbi:MAG: FAD-dependent oxidoreductase [Anaerolineales bacterium]|jgi:Fe-S oxidoreductase|nr:FAD-dependent oxidoreductase [Anaerolineales bacterium]